MVRLVSYAPFAELVDPPVFKAYVRSVCRNVARTYLRRVVERRSRELEESQILDETVADQQPTVQELAEALELFEDILGELDPADRRLVELVVEGYPTTEIAELTGLSYSNVSVRLHRLRRRLRKYLSDKEMESDDG
jgi:RNA polymerase sigma-70 factor (ECF subfamily)